MDLERNLLSKVIHDGDLGPLFRGNITRSFFQDDEHIIVARWLFDFWDEHGAVPTLEALQHEFPQWEVAEAPDPISYYIDKVRDLRRYLILRDTLEEALEGHKEEDNDATIKALSAGLQHLHEEVSTFTDEDHTETTEQRWDMYMTLEEHEGLLGIPTGFPTIDAATGGYQGGQLITVIGEPKSGKSTVTVRSAVATHDAGYRPAVVSFEMSNFEQQARADAMRAKIGYTRLVHGRLRPGERKALQASMKRVKEMAPMWFIHDPGSTSTLSALAAKVQQYQPSIVFVDGVYLMDVEIDAEPNSPQALTYLTRGFKRLAQRLDIPFVIVTQALSWKVSRKKGLTQDAIGYSSSFAQDSDVILGVETNAETGSVLRIVSARNAARQTVVLKIDWETSTIEESDEVISSGGGDDDEEDGTD